jgi:hypothetical protein
MIKSIGIFFALAYTIWVHSLDITAASEYVPWEKGDYAVYADSSNTLTRIEIDIKEEDWMHYTNFAGLGSLWVQTNPGNEQVFIRPTKMAQKQLFIDFNEPEGTIAHVQIDPCNKGSVQIISKKEQLSIPAGEFKNVIQLAFETSCADSGVIYAWFAPGTGFIKWESLSISGPVSTEMIQGTIGKNTYPQGLLISAFFPDPSVIIDMEPPVDPDRPPDTVSAYLIITNNTGRDLTYKFSSGQIFEIKLVDSDGNIISQWSRGRAFTEAIQTLILKQGESWKFGGKIELTTDEGDVIPARDYTLIIEMTSSPDPETDYRQGSERLSASAPLSITHAL